MFNIELLSCNLLDENSQTVKDVEFLQKGLFKEIGWHYYVDLVWVVKYLQMMGVHPGATILDAGAGNGLLQYLLAYYGYNVISVDFSPRKTSLLAKPLFTIEKINSGKKFSSYYIDHTTEVNSLKYKIKKLGSLLRKGMINIFSFAKLFIKVRFGKTKPGKISIYQADMRDMSAIAENTVDAIVSVSAIEHMEIPSIKSTLSEFNRVLKANRPMIISTSATKSPKDWYHIPSEGWCFSLKTLASLFNNSETYSGTFNDFDNVLLEYKNNSFLKDRLASIYFVSRKNGMPRGVWEPRYIPVGIVATPDVFN